MKRKKKSLRLHFAVYLIIGLLMFSVIGVVVVYLNGIQVQQDQYDAFYAEQAQDAIDVAPIDIAPLPGEGGTIIDGEEDTDIVIDGLPEGVTVTIAAEGEELPEEEVIPTEAPEIEVVEELLPREELIDG